MVLDRNHKHGRWNNIGMSGTHMDAHECVGYGVRTHEIDSVPSLFHALQGIFGVSFDLVGLFLEVL